MINVRTENVLKFLIEDYIGTKSPVSSTSIAKTIFPKTSSATIRNDMSKLEQYGYITRPHISSGGIPLSKGYRQYVNNLDDALVLEKYEMSQIQEIFSNINDDIEEIIKETAKLLSVICDNLTIITFPKSEITKLRHIELVFIDEYSIFFVIIDSNLMVKKELIKSETVVTKEELIKISNKLNELFKGKTKDSINIVDLNGLEKELGAKIIDVLTILDSEQTEYEINGLVRLIAQPEFSEIEKNNVITDMIEGDRDLLSQIFSDNIDNNTFDVTICSENKESKLHDLSLIKMSYGLDNAFLGSLAIVGPTRMTYMRIIGVLKVVSELMRNRISFLLGV